MKSKRIISLFGALLLLFSILSSTALAYEPEFPPDEPDDPLPYTYISTIYVDLDITNSGLTQDYCQVYIPDTTCSCWIYMYLEKWNSNTSHWDVVKSWSTNGSDTITLDKEWYVLYGYAYQLRNAIYVYDSDNRLAETTTAYSVIVPYGATYP